MTIFYSPSMRGFLHDGLHQDMPADALEVTPQQHIALLEMQSQGCSIEPNADGFPVAVPQLPPTPDQVRAQLRAAVQRHLDTVARSRGFDNVASAVSYADEPAVPEYQADGQALRAWRSLVWRTALDLLNAESGVPTTDQLMAALPAAPGGR